MMTGEALNTAHRLRQTWTIARLQVLRVFFSRRSFWVYLLAFFPCLVFLGHAIEVKIDQSRWASRSTPVETLEGIRLGDSGDEVIQRAGEPINDNSFRMGPDDDSPLGRRMMYFDGRQRWWLHFEEGILQDVNARPLVNFEDDRRVFAAVFQNFYLRLAVFFGCLGIFINLFRGEMLDKTLHFWFLAPARREVLLAGKYLAGLIAAVVIFSCGAIVSFLLMLWPQDAATLAAFWRDHAFSHIFWYAASASLGCVGYGSVFLAAGLLLRNPIMPAVVILSWESINGILPAVLQKLSVLYYVQSLTPVPAPIDSGAPILIQMLMAPAEPPSAAAAIFGVLGVTALVLWAASRAVRRLEIDYGVE